MRVMALLMHLLYGSSPLTENKFRSIQRGEKKCWYVKQLAKTCELFSLLLSFLSLQPFLTQFLVGKYAHHKKCTSVSNYWDMSVFSPQKTFADYKIQAKWYKSAEMLITAHSCSLWAGEKAQNILGAQEPNKTFTASTCTPHTVYISGWEYTVAAYQKWIKFPPNTYMWPKLTRKCKIFHI